MDERKGGEHHDGDDGARDEAEGQDDVTHESAVSLENLGGAWDDFRCGGLLCRQPFG